MLLNNSPKGYLIKQKNQTVGLNEYHGNRIHQYVIGFKSSILARKVHYNMDPEPVLRLERKDRINITNEVNSLLAELNVSGVDNEVYIDVMSMLYVPKMSNPGGIMDPMNDGGFHLQEEPLEDLYMMPFEKNIGMILPYDLLMEDKKQMVLACQVIDPVDSTKHFRRVMKRLL